MYHLSRTTTKKEAAQLSPVLAALLMAQKAPATQLVLPDEPRLLQEHQKIAIQTQRHDLSVRPIGIFPTVTSPQIFTSDQHDWFLAPMDKDPLYWGKDGFPVPQRNLQQIDDILAADIDFDDLLIAHEQLPGVFSSVDQVTAAMLTPGPSLAAQAKAERNTQIARAGMAVTALPWLGAGLLTAVAGTAAVAVVGGAFAAGALLGGLDPMVIGVIHSRRYPVSMWYFLTAWAYD